MTRLSLSDCFDIELMHDFVHGMRNENRKHTSGENFEKFLSRLKEKHGKISRESKQTEPPKINFFSLLKKLMETRQTFARNTSRKHHLSFPKKCISKYKQRTWQTRKQAVQVSTKGHKTELEIAKMRTLRGYRSVWLIVKQLTFRSWPDSSLFTGILEYILDMQFGKDRRTHASKEYWWWMLFQTLTFCHEPLVTKL